MELGREGIREERETMGKRSQREGHGFGKEGEGELTSCPSEQKSCVRMGLDRQVIHSSCCTIYE
jgi:hypothetical protein